MGSPIPIDFQTDARESLEHLVSASAALISQLDQRPQKPADVVRSLKLDKKLGWQVYRIATATDPMHAGAYLLSPVSVQKLLDAADVAGVGAEVCKRLSDAFEECEVLIRRHASDRASFALMATSAADSVESEIISIADRRAAYRAQSRILGMTSVSSFKAFIFHPGDPKNEFGDAVSLRGTSQLVPLRPQLRWPITSAGLISSDHEELDHGNQLLPLPGCKARAGISIIEPFCSQPLPKIEHHTEEDGSYRSDLVLQGIGRTHATTVVLGYHAPNTLQRVADHSNNMILANFPIRVPCEYCYLDVLVHQDLQWPNQFEPEIFGDSFEPGAPIFDRTHNLLPFHGDIKRGPASRITAVQPPIENYQKLLDWTCSGVGWNLADFHATRVIIQYPVMPSTLCLRTRL